MSIGFVPRHRVEVVSGGMERFLTQLHRSDFDPAPGMLATIVLEESPSGSRGYLFTAVDLSEALARVRRGDDPLGALAARSGGVPLVGPEEQPEGEAIVLGPDGIEGAWVWVQAIGEWSTVDPDISSSYRPSRDEWAWSGDGAADGSVGEGGEAEAADAPPDFAEAQEQAQYEEPKLEPAAEAMQEEVTPPDLPAASEPPAPSSSPPGAYQGPPREPPAKETPHGTEPDMPPAQQGVRGLTRRLGELRRTLGEIAGVTFSGPTGRRGAPVEAGPHGSGAAPPTSGAGGDAAIRRTPHLDAPEQVSTSPRSTFEVSVYTDSASLRPGEEGTDVVIDAPADVKAIDVGVVLLVTGHFSVHGDEYRVLTIERDASDSTPVRFTVEVSEETPEGNAAIQALFLYHGRSCGQVGREWIWEKGQPVARLVEPSGAAPSSVPVHVEARSPDFSVFITAPVNDGMNFKCAVETPHISQYERAQVADFGLPMNSYDYVRRKLESLTDSRSTAEQRRRALRRIGFELWDAAPKLVRDAFWELYDSDEPLESIYIASAEPNLPWELMIPNRPPTGDERLDELEPLGVAFAVGRWTRGDSESPPQQIPVRDAFIVAPDYQVKPLDTARERELLEERFNGTRVHPSSLGFLSYFFTGNHASLLHFACHGTARADGDDAILLEDGQLLAAEVRADEGFRALCRSKAPFVFLNACETGQVVPALGGGAGFPFAFAMIGARAILAPLWPVDDQLAKEVAIELYEEAIADDAPPVAEILRRIRARAYAQPDADTYAAYCFYGDPLARLELVSDA